MWDVTPNIKEEDTNRILSHLLSLIAEEDCPYNCLQTGLDEYGPNGLCKCVVEFFTKLRAEKEKNNA